MGGAAKPDHEAHIACTAASTTSGAESMANAARMQAREASCHPARNRVATPKPTGSALEAIKPIRNAKCYWQQGQQPHIRTFEP
jgi:hypothetical protein